LTNHSQNYGRSKLLIFCDRSSRKFLILFHVLLKHTVTLLIYTFMLPNFDMVQFVTYLAKSQKTSLFGPPF